MSYITKPVFAWGIVLGTLLASTLGCSTRTAETSYELPLVEPDTSDTADPSALAMFSGTFSSTDSVDDWPALFGPLRTSHTDTSVNATWPSSGPKLLWEVEMGTGYGSPVVAEGRVIVNHRVGDEEIIQCHLVSNGELVWQHRYETTATCDVEYSDGPYSTPVIDVDDRQVFQVGGQGQFYCLDFDDGHVVWRRDLHGDYEVEEGLFPVGASPAVDGDQLIFNIGAGARNAGVIAMEKDTGKTLWEATTHGAGYCSPFVTTIHDQRFVFVITDKGLVSLNPDTGSVDWEFEHRSKAPMSYNAVSPLVYNDKVLAVTGPGPGAICVQVMPERSYQVAWKDRRVIDCQYNTLMLHKGLVYSFTSAGQGGAEFRCVEFETGKLRWRYHSILRRGQGLIAGEALLLLGERGHLASLLCDGEEARVLSFTKEPIMSEPCYGAPAVSGTRLFLKDEVRLAAFAVE